MKDGVIGLKIGLFKLDPLSDVATTLYIKEISSDITGRPTSYIQTRNHVSAPDMPEATQTEHWYLIDALI